MSHRSQPIKIRYEDKSIEIYSNIQLTPINELELLRCDALDASKAENEAAPDSESEFWPFFNVAGVNEVFFDGVETDDVDKGVELFVARDGEWLCLLRRRVTDIFTFMWFLHGISSNSDLSDGRPESNFNWLFLYSLYFITYTLLSQLIGFSKISDKLEPEGMTHYDSLFTNIKIFVAGLK